MIYGGFYLRHYILKIRPGMVCGINTSSISRVRTRGTIMTGATTDFRSI